jgi:hypothetical protein
MTIIEVLQIILYFSWITALLALTFVLVRVFKALWPVLEILAVYNKVKSILWMYSQIPDVIKDKAKEFIKK